MHHYGAVASAYEIAGKWQKALHLMNRVHQPNEARMVGIFGQSACDLDGSWKKHILFFRSIAHNHTIENIYVLLLCALNTGKHGDTYATCVYIYI